MEDWKKKGIKNVLLDINGVLFESGEDHPIAGSVEAVKRLDQNGIKFCLVTNECTKPKTGLVKMLNDFGYKSVERSNIVSPAPAACRYLLQNNLRPHLHVWDGVIEDFQPALDKMKESGKEPNCLVVGDPMGKINRDFIDDSLETMLNCTEKPTIVALGAGRYYKDAGKLRMDTGAYVAAFEYCLGVQAINIGKPSQLYFQEALDVVGGSVDDTVLIGDDIISDVGGAKKMGMRGFLVRTGKYKKTDETDHEVKADQVFDDLNEAVDQILKVKELSNI